jgi:L-seryl-tRNA(Ser) seleniumtransferase
MDADTIYEELGVPSVINATGTKTRIGGSRIRPEAVEAMSAASQSFVRLSDLQAEASERIADLTGAEAGYVTSGASAGMLLSAAAAIAGDDISAMARLPDTGGPADTGSPAGDGGLADEIVMPRTHRTGYDHALRAAGATIVDVGTNDRHLGTGSRNVEPWEIERAIGEETAAVGYVQKEYTEPELSVVAEIAHAHDVPVIVDAAAELPPTTNFERFVDDGADLVVFSGGKAIRGPQTTGIVAGRQDLIQSIALQHLDMHVAREAWDPPRELIDPDSVDGVPRQGIGRPMKVGKEELAGLIRALQVFVDLDYDALSAEWQRQAERAAEALDSEDGLTATVTGGEGENVSPVTEVMLDETLSAVDLVTALRDEDPRVYVGADGMGDNEIAINPMCLDDEELDYVVERIKANL